MAVVVGTKNAFVWTTLVDKNDICKDCKVTLYSVPAYQYDLSPSSISVIGEKVAPIFSPCTNSKMVDASGLAVFDLTTKSTVTLFALVEYNGRLQVSSPASYFDYQSYLATDVISEIIHDRGFYKPGDLIHMKGNVPCLENIET